MNQRVLGKWRDILIMVGKTLASAARDMVGLRFQDDEEPARHTAETFQERIKEKRRDELKRKGERKTERAVAANRKNKRMEEDGRRNRKPLEAGEIHERGKQVEYVDIWNFLKEIGADVWSDDSEAEIVENNTKDKKSNSDHLTPQPQPKSIGGEF